MSGLPGFGVGFLCNVILTACFLVMGLNALVAILNYTLPNVLFASKGIKEKNGIVCWIWQKVQNR